MGVGQIFFSFHGRIGRQTYWLATLALTAVLAGGLAGATAYATGEPFSPEVWEPIWAGYYAVMLWCGSAICLKRWHDRNRPAWIYLLFVLLSLVPLVLMIAKAKGLMPAAQTPYEILAYVLLLAFSLYLSVELGFIKGTTGPNRYGPDPLPPAAGAGGGFGNWMFGVNGRIGRSRWWLGMLVALLFAALGLTAALAVTGALLVKRHPALFENAAIMDKLEDPQWIGTPEGEAFAMSLGFMILLVWLPLFCLVLWNCIALGVKRFHDRGLSGWFAVVMLMPLAAVIAMPDLLEYAPEPQRAQISLVVWLLCAVVWLWGMVQLGFLPGEDGRNGYGGGSPKRPEPARLASG
jgi:uncharacterized membrane protein YhaH (DUF805 family)